MCAHGLTVCAQVVTRKEVQEISSLLSCGYQVLIPSDRLIWRSQSLDTMDLGPSICSIPWNGGLRSRRSIGLEVFEGLDPSESLDLEFPIPGILGFGGFEGSESLESLDLMISIPRILGIMMISIPNPPDSRDIPGSSNTPILRIRVL